MSQQQWLTSVFPKLSSCCCIFSNLPTYNYDQFYYTIFTLSLSLFFLYQPSTWEGNTCILTTTKVWASKPVMYCYNQHKSECYYPVTLHTCTPGMQQNYRSLHNNWIDCLLKYHSVKKKRTHTHTLKKHNLIQIHVFCDVTTWNY